MTDKRYEEMTLAEVKLEIEEHLRAMLNDMAGELLTAHDAAGDYDDVKQAAVGYSNLVHALHRLRHGDMSYEEVYGENSVPEVPTSE